MFWTKMRKKIFVLAAAAFLAAGMENFEVVSLAAPAENGIGPGFDNMPEEASAETGETAETGGEASAETGETAETGGEASGETGETAGETGAEASAETGAVDIAGLPEIGAVYGAYLYGSGWTANHEDNTWCQAGAGSYVTALRASLENQPENLSGTISYQVNLSGSGWLDWQENYGQAGSTDTAMPLEAVRFALTGQLAEYYDVYYSVYQNGAWTSLVTNGETAGVEAQGLRVDGIRLAVRKKGAGEPEEPAMHVSAVDPSKPMIALTFDDGPSGATSRILDALEANGGRATFFMVGNRMRSYPSVINRMVALGCEPASHTWDHSYLTKLSEGQILSNLNQVDDTLQSIAGVRTVIVRPPGGYINDASKAALAKRGTPAVLWSIDTLDWKTRNAQKTIDTVLSNVKDGDIILMHDLYETSADAAAVLIPELKNRGYQLVTVSELASYRGGMQPGHTYSRFRP